MHSWIFNTSVIDHVASSIYFFVSHYEIKPIHIKLPNNDHVIAKCIGTICLSYHIMIYHVLYVPEFTLNIVFVQKLTNTLDCQIVFSHDIFF